MSTRTKTRTLSAVILSGALALSFRPRRFCGVERVRSRRICGFLFCFLLLTTFAAAQITPWNKIQAPPLPAFKPQQPVRVQLPNGMVIFLQEDHELPLIGATARIRGGSVYEPAGKTGLTDLYGEVWRTGGTKSKTGDQMDDFLEARAAKIETDAQADSTTISLNCLKGDFDAVFDMFVDLLHHPEFRGGQAGTGEGADVHRNLAPQR